MAPRSRRSQEQRRVRFERRSRVEWLDFEERVRRVKDRSPEDIDVLIRLVTSGHIFRPPQSGFPRPLDVDFSLWRIDPLLLKDLMEMIQELFSGPYTVNFQNEVDIPLQFVWSYELWSGLILVDQTPYTQPGQTAPIQYPHCGEMKQYAFSVWDADNIERYVSPTMTVSFINQEEIQSGTFKACEDTIVVWSNP